MGLRSSRRCLRLCLGLTRKPARLNAMSVPPPTAADVGQKGYLLHTLSRARSAPTYSAPLARWDWNAWSRSGEIAPIVAADARTDQGQEPGVAGYESRGGNRLVAVTERSTIASETVALTFDTSETAATALRAV